MNRKSLYLSLIFMLIFASNCFATASRQYKITAYCTCPICCGKWSDGFCASGRKAKYGYVACNHMKFNTMINIDGLGTFSVQDRGAKKYFGTMSDKNFHIDVLMQSHEDAKQFGVQYRKVTIL